MSFRTRTIAVISIVALVPTLAWALQTTDAEYQSCEQMATVNHETNIINETYSFNVNQMNALNDHRNRAVNAWNIPDDNARSAELRASDQDIRSRIQAFQTDDRNNLRNIDTAFRNDEQNCRNALQIRNNNRRQVPVGRTCFNSNDCFAPTGICTTDFGDCRQTCLPGSNPCVQTCSGVCQLR